MTFQSYAFLILIGAIQTPQPHSIVSRCRRQIGTTFSWQRPSTLWMESNRDHSVCMTLERRLQLTLRHTPHLAIPTPSRSSKQLLRRTQASPRHTPLIRVLGLDEVILTHRIQETLQLVIFLIMIFYSRPHPLCFLQPPLRTGQTILGNGEPAVLQIDCALCVKHFI